MQKWRVIEISGIISILLFILSTLLIFVMEFWYVLIINTCEYLAYRIVFRKTDIPLWMFPIVCTLSIGIMVLAMFYPDKICGGIMQNPELAANFFPEAENISDMLREYHINSGIVLTVLIVHYIIVAAIIIARRVDCNYADSSYSYYVSLPLASMGTLIALNFICKPSESGIFGTLYPLIISFVQIFISECQRDDGWSGGSSNSGGDTYDIYIVKH